jgi:hypothetical protein
MSEAGDRAYVAAMLDSRAARLSRARAEMDEHLQELRETWATTAHQETEAAEARIAQLRADQATWFSNFIDGEASEPASNQDPAARAPDVDASFLPTPSGSSSPDGHQPGRRPDLTAAEIEAERARQIAGMSMSEYMARRAELGVRSPESMARLFS